MKIINYKKARNEALEAMFEFRKMGDDKMADAYLNLAVHIESTRTDIQTKIYNISQ